MSEQKAPYTAKFERLEGSRMRDDWWGWENDEAEDTNPLDLANYNNFETDEITRLEGQIRLLTAALDAATSQQDGQGHVKPAELLLEDVRAEFAAVYNETPEIFQVQWERVAKLLGVTK